MSKFRVYGTNRKVGALGLHDYFWVEVEADDKTAAEEKARAERYAAGYEHVHIRDVSKISERKAE